MFEGNGIYIEKAGSVEYGKQDIFFQEPPGQKKDSIEWLKTPWESHGFVPMKREELYAEKRFL